MNPNDRSIIGLVMGAHGLAHTYGLSLPIFMTVWLTEFGVTETPLGSLVGAGYFLFGTGARPGGILADRFGAQIKLRASLALIDAPSLRPKAEDATQRRGERLPPVHIGPLTSPFWGQNLLNEPCDLGRVARGQKREKGLLRREAPFLGVQTPTRDAEK